MFWDVDGRQTEMKMLGCRMAVSSKAVMQQLEMSVDWQLLVGMVARAVDVTMLTEVDNGWAGRRHETADSGMVARDHVIPETPRQPPWSQYAVVDAASAELQRRPWHGRNDVVEIPDEPQRWEQTGGAAVEKQEAWPGRSCRSRVLSAQATPPDSGSSRQWHLMG